MRHFVIGDIHGAYKALKQCLDRSSFDYKKDQLICLGDVCDGWPETNQSIEELLKINNLIFILGNHDYWALNWALYDTADDIWLSQGGANTLASYEDKMPHEHIKLLKDAHLYYINENRLFVHAGIDISTPIERQGADTFLWDRTLFKKAMANSKEESEGNLTSYDEIYIGHTPIHNYNMTKPTQACEVWFMDTGAGWSGVLSLMEIDTREIYQSDKVDTLYPKGSGRIRY